MSKPRRRMGQVVVVLHLPFAYDETADRIMEDFELGHVEAVTHGRARSGWSGWVKAVFVLHDEPSGPPIS